MVEYEELRLRLLESEKTVKNLKEALAIDTLKGDIAELEKESAKPDFWDDMENSQKVMQKIGSLKAKVQSYENVKNEFDDALVMAVANLVFHVIIALCSNNFYKAKVIKTVKDVNQKIDEGGMLEQMIPFGNSTPMSQDDLKKLYLNKMGGTSLFSPVLAFCVLDLITSIISKL